MGPKPMFIQQQDEMEGETNEDSMVAELNAYLFDPGAKKGKQRS